MGNKKPSVTNINYSGKLEIKYKYRGKTISSKSKNNGTINLFNLLASAVCGYDVSGSAPMYIDVISKNSNRSILGNKCVVSSRTIKQDNSVPIAYVYCLSTLTPENLIPVVNGNYEESYTVHLMTAAGLSLATTDIQGAVIQNIADGYQGNVEWTLSFSNGIESV